MEVVSSPCPGSILPDFFFFQIGSLLDEIGIENVALPCCREASFSANVDTNSLPRLVSPTFLPRLLRYWSWGLHCNCATSLASFSRHGALLMVVFRALHLPKWHAIIGDSAGSASYVETCVCCDLDSRVEGCAGLLKFQLFDTSQTQLPQCHLLIYVPHLSVCKDQTWRQALNTGLFMNIRHPLLVV